MCITLERVGMGDQAWASWHRGVGMGGLILGRLDYIPVRRVASEEHDLYPNSILQLSYSFYQNEEKTEEKICHPTKTYRELRSIS